MATPTRHRARISELLGPERTTNSRSPGSFYSSCIRPTAAAGSDFLAEARPEAANANGTILSALGDITNKLCSVQSSVTSLSNKVDDLSTKTENLSKRVASIEEQPVKKKSKIQIPHELSTIVRRLYKASKEKKFKTSEKFDSDYNHSIADSLINQITIAGKYNDEHLVSSAVKRYFVSQVRASKTITPAESKKKRIVARRTKLFERRSKYIKNANERSLWKHVTAALMSDEETDDEDEGFIVRKLSWRSDLLNKLVVRLDKRYEKKRKSATSRSKPKEKRKSGDVSARSQPKGIAKWALQQAPSSSPQVRESPSSPEEFDEPLSIYSPHSSAEYAGLSSEDSAKEDSTEEESDGELSTMIRAATMTLYGPDN